MPGDTDHRETALSDIQQCHLSAAVDLKGGPTAMLTRARGGISER